MNKNCKACRYCFMEPSDDQFCCGHPDAGPLGIHTVHAAGEGGHCGPDRPKFEQHPCRTPTGDLILQPFTPRQQTKMSSLEQRITEQAKRMEREQQETIEKETET